MEHIPNALEGVNVLDFTQFASGPICTLTLAHLGANIIKVERPIYGEAGRAGTKNGEDMLWTTLHANKKSITADMKNPKGKELLFRMIKKCDVVVENMAPGTFERLGFGWDILKEVNPRIIFCQIKGYADNSPWAGMPAFDGPVQATGGIAAQTGQLGGPPTISGIALADDPSGHYAATGILAALYQRTVTGRGQQVRINMQEVAISGSRMSFASQDANLIRGQGLPFVPPSAPNDVFPTKPRENDPSNNDYIYLYVNMRTPGPKNAGWIGLCNSIGKPEWINDPNFESGAQRWERREEIRKAIIAWTLQHDKEVAMRILGGAGVPCGAVLSIQDIMHDQSMLDSGFLQVMHHSEFGDIIQVGSAYHLSDTKFEIQPSPKLGQHNDEIYKGFLGLSNEEYEAYKACGAI
jgi:formyl-CoA transferase